MLFPFLSPFKALYIFAFTTCSLGAETHSLMSQLQLSEAIWGSVPCLRTLDMPTGGVGYKPPPCLETVRPALFPKPQPAHRQSVFLTILFNRHIQPHGPVWNILNMSPLGKLFYSILMHTYPRYIHAHTQDPYSYWEKMLEWCLPHSWDL